MAVFINLGSCKNSFSETNSVNKLCSFIMEERAPNNDERFISSGAFGVTDSEGLKPIINQMKAVQNFYNINERNGRRMTHMCLSITEKEFCDIGCNDELLIDYFRDCARDVYNSGYQVAYCIHTNQKKHNDCKNHAFSHLHLGINSVNYENGKKFHATKGEIIRGNEYETDKLNSYKEASAVRFKNIDEYRKREIENIK